MESFWATLERGRKGVFYKFSKKHLQRYVDEFAGRHNVRNRDALDMMNGVFSGMVGSNCAIRTLLTITDWTQGRGRERRITGSGGGTGPFRFRSGIRAD